MVRTDSSVGELLREWRLRRRLSQLDLACDAEVSTKYVSFLETGRSRPGRDMVLHLADRLAIPLRDRNIMLGAAGFPPTYQERALTDPEFRLARRNIDLILQVHQPNPALAIDRHWYVIGSNPAVSVLTDGVDPMLLTPSVNLVRLSLHPAGLAPRIQNLAEWRRHLIARLREQIEVTGDPALVDLVEEVRDYPTLPGTTGRPPPNDLELLAVPFQLATVHGVLAFFCTTTVFGAPLDITLSELCIESFFPADAVTARVMRDLGREAAAGPEAV